MFKFPRAFLSNLLFSLNRMLSSAEPENENKPQMVSTGYFGGKNLFEKLRTNYDWDKMHVPIFIIYPELSEKSLTEKSSYGLLNYTAEVSNFSLSSLVVRRINGVREDRAFPSPDFLHVVLVFPSAAGGWCLGGVHGAASASSPRPSVPWALGRARETIPACWSILS